EGGGSQPLARNQALEDRRARNAVMVFEEKAGLFECALFARDGKVQYHIRWRQNSRHEVHAGHYMFIALQHTKRLAAGVAAPIRHCSGRLEKPRPRTIQFEALVSGSGMQRRWFIQRAL